MMRPDRIGERRIEAATAIRALRDVHEWRFRIEQIHGIQPDPQPFREAATLEGVRDIEIDRGQIRRPRSDSRDCSYRNPDG